MKLAVRQARAVGQKIAERDRLLCRIRLVQRPIRITQDAEAGEFWSISRDGLIQ